jgi:RAD51-like protein 2
MSSRRSLLSLGYSRTILSALTRSGYETVQDISTSTPDGLARGVCCYTQKAQQLTGWVYADLNISLDVANEIYALSQKPSSPTVALPVTQPASVMAQQTQKVPTGIAALDKILEGGVSRGHILEISGPPGSPKELVAMKIVSSFVNAREEVFFVGAWSLFLSNNLPYHVYTDCQNMANPSHLRGVIERLRCASLFDLGLINVQVLRKIALMPPNSYITRACTPCLG